MLKKSKTLPRIVIDETLVGHLEELASGASERAPDLADRLLTKLSRARLVAPNRMPPNVVTIGNRVSYRDMAAGEERDVALVFPEEADIAQGRVSVLTPIGVALLGLSVGARFTWQTRSGETKELTVMQVHPADAG